MDNTIGTAWFMCVCFDFGGFLDLVAERNGKMEGGWGMVELDSKHLIKIKKKRERKRERNHSKSLKSLYSAVDEPSLQIIRFVLYWVEDC